MAQIVAEYTDPIVAKDGTVWSARVSTRRVDGPHWEGWIEFVPLTRGHKPIRSAVESTQPNLSAMKYWAGGLTPAYMQGALERARSRPAIVETDAAPALFNTPAPPIERVEGTTTRPRPLLDPFDVYAQGEQRLLDQLAALGDEHIRDIAVAYEFVRPEAATASTRAELIARIVSAARAHLARA